MKFSGNQRICEFLAANPAAVKPMSLWIKIIRENEWKSNDDVRRTFNYAEFEKPYWVFPIHDLCKVVGIVVFAMPSPYDPAYIEPTFRVVRVLKPDDACDPNDWHVSDEKYEKLKKKRRDEDEIYLDAIYERVHGKMSYDELAHLRHVTYMWSYWEERHAILPNEPTKLVDRLNFVLTQNDLNSQSLSSLLGIPETDADAICAGNRLMSTEEVQKLAKQFCLHPVVFGAVNAY